MRMLSVSCSLLALVFCAGCAQQPRTTEMGASSAAVNKVYCRDGAWMPSTAGCGDHGGVERAMSAPSQK